MDSKLDVVAIGELLIDFIPAGLSPAGNTLFERNPGGAPANVLVALSMLGGKGAFIGKVGSDQFGDYLRKVLFEYGIDTTGLRFSDKANTTLAFIHLDEKGDRSFSFCRKPGADTMLEESDIEYGLIDKAEIFHFGSLSMTDEPSKTATIKAVEYAKSKGKIISYDPNWRLPLWESEKASKAGMIKGLEYADILKLSEIELEFLTGVKDLNEGSHYLLDMGIKLVLVTLGSKGCFYRHASGIGHLHTYDTRVVDTTGAGDAFLGGLLFKLSIHEADLDNLEKRQIEEMIDFSNAVGAVCTSKKGAIPAMPSLREVEKCICTTSKLRLDYI